MTDQPPVEPVVVGDPPPTSTPTRRTRTSVTVQPEQNKQPGDPGDGEPVLAPPEIQHTPTHPLGTVSNYAEPVTNIPPGTPINVAADPTKEPDVIDPHAQALAGALVSTGPGYIEIAAPAPLPRPGDERLTRGTAAHAVLQEELTGVAPEMPDDPNSQETQQAFMDQRKADLEQQKEAAESIQANQQKLLDAQPKPNVGPEPGR